MNACHCIISHASCGNIVLLFFHNISMYTIICRKSLASKGTLFSQPCTGALPLDPTGYFHESPPDELPFPGTGSAPVCVVNTYFELYLDLKYVTPTRI